MDPAEVERVSDVLRTQEARLNRQEEFQTAMASQMGHISTQLQDLLGQLARQTAPAPLPAPEATPTPTMPPFGAGSKLAPPAQYTGEPGQCKTFLIDCSIHFELNPLAFPTDRSKIAFMITHLAGRAKAWASAEWGRGSSTCLSLTDFQAALTRTFDPVTTSWEKAQELSSLKQGSSSVCDYAIRFRTLAVESGWNATALYDIFLKGLSTHIQDLLVPLDLPTDVDSLIALAIRTDNRLTQLQRQRGRGPATAESHLRTQAPAGSARHHSPQEQRHPPSAEREEEPMQLGRARLTPEERRKRQLEGRCFYCGETGHLVAACPTKKSLVVSLVSASTSPPRTLTKVQVKHHTDTELEALIDSGADESLMDWGLARKLGLDVELLERPVRARSLNGLELFSITHVSEPVPLQINNHKEVIRFYLFKSSSHSLILGQSWLLTHNPHIDWRTGEIRGWGDSCTKTCLEPPYQKDEVTEINLFSTHPATDAEFPDLNSVPTCYHHLRQVFSKTKALSLPPHRPYDCAIDLIPGSTIPKGRLYSVSGPEKEAIKEYITASLKAGLIRPSSSPAGAGFFFVGKKDGSLRPCIDYSPLNDITIKNRYPLPLMSSVFDQLQQAKVFTKLDLRNAYHLIRIREGDEWKTGFNTPSGHYEYRVMPFGLTNAPAVFQAMINDVLRDFLDHFVYVYLDDILIYSPDLDTHRDHVNQVLKRLLANHLYVKAEKSVFHADTVSFLGFIVAPGSVQMDPAKVSAVAEWPTPDSRKKVQQFLGFAKFYRRFVRGFSAIAAPLHALTSTQVQFHWSPEAEKAFKTLKHRFTSAPILTLPDPTRQFVVEVDASNEGIGAVLSQRSERDGKMHPCAFLSRRLSRAERNYDVGNRELLAVKLALEEWRHWLEGADHPFIVWTDHKNLEYIRKAKRLNSRQARWALFFNRFSFSLSYRPGSRNVKPDVLSRLFDPEPEAKEPETILPLTHVVGAVTWPIETEVKRAIGGAPSPSGCPANRLFVPTELRPQVIHWAHTTQLSCHPGVKRTMFVISRRFWWPSMETEVREYVEACSVCARNKMSSGARMGLLQPLPIPSRPWSDISLDFVTGLPVSQGNTTVLTVVDRFSKMVRFIALPKLPSAKETAEVMMTNVFKVHGFPKDIVSDRGPQFVSRFWREFCRLIGAKASLTSGYHPEANGQTERLNQQLETGLRCVVYQNPSTWSKHLVWVEYAHNSLPTSATGLSPFKCVYGYQPPVFPDNEPEVSVPSAHALIRRCRRIWMAARQVLIRQGDRVKKAADRRRRPAPDYQPGQRVWLSAKDLHLKVPSKKLAPRFVGPFPVTRMVGPAAVRLRLPRSLRVHPTFHVSQIKPVKESLMVPATTSPPPPEVVEGGPVYKVKRLLAVRNRGRGRQFLVDWEGYGPEERQWVPSRHIVDPTLIDDFYRDHPELPGPSGVGPRGRGTVTPR
uniref:Gypsy retrotransposon integrase-like protein 1 n=1 Tax=Sparus aurata TaxID=8175 RepID=A0A671YIT6_SPAAU